MTEHAGGPSMRLELRNISKAFGGIRALDDVSFAVGGGEIHALVGENGAGKSTLVKIVTGLHSADSGTYLLDGVPREFQSVLDARAAGVIAVHQDPRLFPHLDVAENIFMGIQPTTRLGTIDRRAMYGRAQEMLDRLDAQLDATALVAGLSIGETQFVEFARALIEGADKLLILDEPTAALSPSETERLFRILRQIKAAGTSVIFISHRLEELAGLVETVTVLRDGKHVTTRPAQELTQADVVRLMVGRSIDALYPVDESESPDLAYDTDGAPDVLRVEALALRGVFEDVSFNVAPGEIVGMAGLVGAGRTEIAQTLFGITPPTSGRVFIQGKEISIRGPRQMLRQGLAYVPEDRESEGLFADLSITKNVVLPVLRQLATAGMLRPARERKLASRQARDLQIKAASLEGAVSALSGGNRQKVVLGKWLATGPAILILDEPTHGIDVGAKAQVHQIIRRLASSGVGILMISSDLPEVLRMSDRILVVSDGHLAGEFTRAEATQELVMTAATSGGKGLAA